MLEIVDVIKDYYVDKKAFRALKGINLFFPKQQFCSILGPSGCGKTTTLNIIGGLDQYTSGDLIIEGQSTKTYNDKDWDNYRNKRVGFVFQSYNLIPQLNLQDNVAMALTLNGVSRKERIERARVALDEVGLNGLYNKKPNQLSGGQMQRVAIARAIINNPEVVLADEPTGALDSVTSVQIMDILKEISKDRLVIMVTHNEDLANKYSDRIIKFLDGEVSSDSLEKEMKILRDKENKEYQKKNDISLKDFEIIDEKKNRKLQKAMKERKSSMSFWTALKLSFGNLLTKKGRTSLTSVAGSFGIIGVALVLSVNNGFGNYVARMEKETASQMPITVASYSVTYEYDADFVENESFTDKQEIYVTREGRIARKLVYNNITPKYISYLEKLKNKEKIVSDYIISYGDEYGYNLSTTLVGTDEPYIVENTSFLSYSSILSTVTGLPTQFFHVLYGEESDYDVIAGNYCDSEDKGDLMLMVNERNELPLGVLKRLGFIPDDENYDEKYAEEHPVSFDDIIGKKFKVFPNKDFYTTSSKSVSQSTYEAYYYEQNDLKTLYEDENAGIECRIAGILRPKKDSSIQTMASGLCYQKSLQDYLVESNQQEEVYKNIEHNMTWKDGASLISLLSDLQELQEENVSELTATKLNRTFSNYLTFYNLFSGESENSSGEPYTFSDYIGWANKLGVELIDDELKASGLDGIPDYLARIIRYLSEGSFDVTTKQKAYPYIISVMAFMNNYSAIDNVIIFSPDLTAKETLKKRLDDYNKIDTTGSLDHASSQKEVVNYTDIVGTLTSSLSQMIDIISVVLIVFASISLVVSCVMTGIITYVSVIERTKEIGVLRAVGARKKDVGRLFEAECVFIGLGSGVFGCLVAWVATFPINGILNALYGSYNIGNIADLAVPSMLFLIVISVVLTFVSSLFPARAAAKKDPVIALRTE